MDERERHAAGMSKRREVLGHAYVDQATAAVTPLTAEFQDLITRYAWGEIWTRPGLDTRSRRVLVIGTMVALGLWDELRMHIRAALADGQFTGDDVKEIILQQAIYCGVPAANRAFAVLSSVIAETAPPAE
jgi:4-carboxymuconolactone decarboxylase